MPQVNAIVQLRPSRLNFPLATLYARALHSFVIALENIPLDCYSVIVRVFKLDGVSHFDLPVALSTDGRGTCYCIGTCFPNVGATRYEVHAYDGEGNMTALGEGAIEVGAFTATGAPIEPGQSVPIMQITDSTGALHTIKAVSDGMGGFTTIIDDDSED